GPQPQSGFDCALLQDELVVDLDDYRRDDLGIEEVGEVTAWAVRSQARVALRERHLGAAALAIAWHVRRTERGPVEQQRGIVSERIDIAWLGPIGDNDLLDALL